MAEQKNISYLNKNFLQYKASLIEFAKNYFPNTYTDFSEASPGTMFIEMASYVGDVLSFYTDTQIQENFVLTAKEKENLLNMAYSLGYRPKSSYAAVTTIDFYQRVPIVGGQPDLDYALIIPENISLRSVSNNTNFITLDPVDFSNTGSLEITLYDSNNYLFKKSVRAISATLQTQTFTFGVPIKFTSVEINDSNFLQILQVTGSDASQWYEVPYLAQSNIVNKTTNTGPSSNQVPYLLNYLETPNRFVSRIRTDDVIELQFGSGMYVNDNDNVIIPTPDSIQLGLVSSVDTSDLVNNYNQAAIFYTKQYGTVPSNITLTVQYLSGGGVSSNVPANDITVINSTAGINAVNPIYNNTSLATLIANNPIPAAGGRSGDTVEEIRLKYLAKIKIYKQMKSVVVSLSGGMDSSTLLLRALSEYDNVIAVSFDYGQKHRVELERAQSLVNYLKEQGQQVKYQTIKLDGLTPLLNSALVEGGEEVPEGHYEQENMKATVVPNRNKIFRSIVQAIADYLHPTHARA